MGRAGRSRAHHGGGSHENEHIKVGPDSGYAASRARTSLSAKAMHTRCTTVAVTHQIRSYDCECCCDDKVVVAASRLQAHPASRARLEDEAFKLPAQKLAAGRMLGDSQGVAPHGAGEPLDQPQFANDEA